MYNASIATPYIPGPLVPPPAPTGPSPNQSIIRPENRPATGPAPAAGIFPAWTAPVAPSVYAAANWQGVKQLGAGSYGTVSQVH